CSATWSAARRRPTARRRGPLPPSSPRPIRSPPIGGAPRRASRHSTRASRVTASCPIAPAATSSCDLRRAPYGLRIERIDGPRHVTVRQLVQALGREAGRIDFHDLSIAEVFVEAGAKMPARLDDQAPQASDVDAEMLDDR